LYHFRDEARYWSKIAFFHTASELDTTLWGLRQNIAVRFGAEKLEWCGYPTVKLPDGKKKFEDMITLVLTQYMNVTDSRMDGQTPHDGIGRAYA